MVSNRLLTKSMFKLGLECPRKLFYVNKPDYFNKTIDNPFLDALKDGGFQVGELAKCYHPEGIEVNIKDNAQACTRTLELLKENERITLFEAAFQAGSFFVRVDILVKEGNLLQLFEVKSKSFTGDDSNRISTRKGGIVGGWKPYIYDIVFQQWVISQACPEYELDSFLLLADKTKIATVDGLNQKFRLFRTETGKTSVTRVGDTSHAALGNDLLTPIPIRKFYESVISDPDFEQKGVSFARYAEQLANYYQNDVPAPIAPSRHCQRCEFRKTGKETGADATKKCGFKLCWMESFGLAEDEFYQPMSFDIWKLSHNKKDSLLKAGRYFLKQVRREDIQPSKMELTRADEFSVTDRQMCQIEKYSHNDPNPELKRDGLKEEMSHWTYPLHMIDFETMTAAIPFYRGSHPYQTIAFQFSHHTIQADGQIAHQGEFIHMERGVFPNFEFVRELRRQLSDDEGSIFRYHVHENSVLRQIHAQLAGSRESDKQELMEFIDRITYTSTHIGERSMIDLYDMVRRFYYSPQMGGSISLKYVLPAVLNDSCLVRRKYANPIYGAVGGIPSHNYRDKIWIETDSDGTVRNPYKSLPPLFEEIPDDEIENFGLFDGSEGIAEGGSAMMAYARIQFAETIEAERCAVRDGLLRYCELDTLAMVFLWEYFHDITKD